MPRRPAQLAVVLALVGCFVAMAWTSARQKSVTFDEGYFVVAGYQNWLRNDYRVHSGNGVLPQRWMSLPHVLAPETFRFPDPEQIVQNFRVRDLAELSYFMIHVFFYEVGNDLDQILRSGRPMAIALAALLPLLVFFWSRSLFGSAGGFISLAVCAFSPNWLAHGRLMTADVTLSLGLLASVGVLWSLWHRATPLRVLGSGLVLAALSMSKLSGLLVVPMALLMLVPRLLSPQPLRWRAGGREREFASRPSRITAIAAFAALQLCIVVASIWLAHGLRFATEAPGAGGRDAIERSWASFSQERNFPLRSLDFAREAKLLPEAYLHSLGYVLKNSEKGRRNFLRGEVREHGSVDFLPYVVAIKTPLGLFALVGLAAAYAGRSAVRARRGSLPEERAGIAYALTPIAALVFVYGATALSSNINLGLRHVLPIYPALFLLAGGSGLWLRERHRFFAPLTALSLAAVVAASLTTWPHYLAFFNSTVGSQQAYRHLADSSLDWGQDLDGLARWLEREGYAAGGAREQTPVYLAYFGMADPIHHDIRARHLPSFFDWPKRRVQWRGISPGVELEAGVYCISATMLQRVWLAAPGPWTPERELHYRALRARFEPDEPLSEEAAGALLEASDTRTALLSLRDLRFHRLTRFLLQREPDTHIGHSILIYQLDEADVRAARDGIDWLPPLRS